VRAAERRLGIQGKVRDAPSLAATVRLVALAAVAVPGVSVTTSGWPSLSRG